MFTKVFVSLAAAASLVSAIDITAPVANSTITKGSYANLTWTSVDTDPTLFSVFLVNFVNWPPTYVQLTSDTPTSDLSASVYIPCDTDDSAGYQFNAINGTNVYVIYAQSDEFTVGGDSCEDPVTTSTASTCAAAATVTVTVSPAHANATTAPGLVPKTIGWCSGYSEPVTLAAVPTSSGCTATATPVLHGDSGSWSANGGSEWYYVEGGQSGVPAVTKAATLTAGSNYATVTQWVTQTVYDESDTCTM